MEKVKLNSKALDLRKEDVEMNTRERITRNRIRFGNLVKADDSKFGWRLSDAGPGLFSGRDVVIPDRATESTRVERTRTRPQFQPSISIKHRLASSRNPFIAGKQAIAELRKLDIESKPFCLHKGNERSFVVNGEQFKWAVVRIKHYKDILNMPKDKWNTLVKLEKAGVIHNGVYIAFPLKGTALEKTKKEIKAMCRDAVTRAGAILTTPFHITAGIADLLKNDPILLLRLSGFKQRNLFLDLGRWE